MPFLSFVVPVYNVRKYLSECVESVRRQSFDDWEMILIDDRSSDDSGSLCDEWCKRDARIRTVHLGRNVGPGGARNAGLASAEGEYIVFLDGDDQIEEGALASLVTGIRGCNFPDIIRVSFAEFFGRTGTVQIDAAASAKMYVSTVDALLSEATKHGVKEQHGAKFYLWQLVMRRELLAHRQFRFQDLRIGEDVDFSLRALFSARQVGVLEGPFYQWRVRLSGSLTSEHIRLWHHLLRSAVEILRLAAQSRLSETKRHWAVGNAYSYVLQFEQIAGAVSETELQQHGGLLSALLEQREHLATYVVKGGLLWNMGSEGAVAGALAFCRQKAETVRCALHGAVERDLFAFPATRRALLFIDVARSLGYRFRGMLDNDPEKQGLLFGGTVVLKPEALALSYADNDRIFVVICTWTRNTADVLAKQLRAYGLVEGRHFTCMANDSDA